MNGISSSIMSIPVSYTHLDVYKRQLVARVLDGCAVKEETVIKLIHLLQEVGGMGMTCLLYTSRCV